MSEEQPSEIQINVKGPNELKLQISITTDKTVRELKEAIAQKTDVEAGIQRLIYSGRVLKDEDPLSTYKIANSHTVHMVKSAVRSSANPSSSSSPSSSSQLPSSSSSTRNLPTMQTGQNPHDPLTQLNSHQGFGAMAGLNPFGEMGLNAGDPNMMQNMFSNPAFLQQMSSMMSNPAIVEQIIASNPQLQAMGPRVREMFQSEGFRQMLSNPESFQQMMRMASMMQGAGIGGGGGGGFPNMFGGGAGGGGGGFPAPGIPNAPPPAAGAATSPPAGSTPAADPFGGMFNPALMQQMMGGMGMGGAPGAGFGGGLFGAPAAPAAPADTRSPEERFQVQLQQLQDMGFTNASQNVRALLATGGNVHTAIEYILGGGGL